ncbi:MAG: glycosyltransferase family 4 protein [Ferruginibacter sp.]|nr:glycosyltransferase family 4 protein [Ferruginibacter sp.]
MGKALCELKLQYGGGVKIFSLYGNRNSADSNTYFPQTTYRGFHQRRFAFVAHSFFTGCRSDIVLLSHVNLLLPAMLVKLFRPKIKLALIAHGIEVWRPFTAPKRWMLGRVDLILPVSHYTKEKMKELYGLAETKFSVMNNCLDPFLEQPLLPGRAPQLLQRYGLDAGDKILLTVSRMADTEQYKGYDRVLEALPDLIKLYPNLHYMMVGKYDPAEKKRLDAIIEKLGLRQRVVFTGFVPDAEMAMHFKLADLFIMPSEKEGFGIVFIEAMFYGLPVIAGNKDGSVDALCNGELGTIIDPDNLTEINDAVKKILGNPAAYKPNPQKLKEQFSYEWYKRKLYGCLRSLLVTTHALQILN